MNLGYRISKLRKDKGLSQEQLAEELYLTRQTISKWELNQSTPDVDYLAKLSNYFGVTTDYLIKGESSFTENISLSHLGRELNFSLPYLSRLFHREVGLSFQQYLQKIRIAHSCRLLAETRLSITQIAQEVGYSDTKHFGKLFRKTVHMSPREFRKSIVDTSAKR